MEENESELKIQQNRLCLLLAEAGASAMRYVFDSIHPPINLKERFASSFIKAVLLRRKKNGYFIDMQWRLLYPLNKNQLSSINFCFDILVVLLESVCHISSPYPTGWESEPLDYDTSIGADIVRLKLAKRDVSSTKSLITDQNYDEYWSKVTDAILRLGGPNERMLITRIETEPLTAELRPCERITVNYNSVNKTRLTKKKSVFIRERFLKKASKSVSPDKVIGIPIEDQTVLMKSFKLLVDNVDAADAMDRLEQNQVITMVQRQGLKDTDTKQDQMMQLLQIIKNHKSPQAFRMLCESIRFKYPKIYASVTLIRQSLHKEIITANKTAVLLYCREALALNYVEQLSHIKPLPWSEKTASITDIYVPTVIIDCCGHQVIPTDILTGPKSTMRRCMKVHNLHSGYGNTMLSQYLTYQWASKADRLHKNYDLLLYINLKRFMKTRSESLLQYVYYHNLPAKFKLELSQFCDVAEANMSSTLLILDGYSEATETEELKDILRGSKFLKGQVFLLTNDYNSNIPLMVAIQDNTMYNLYNFGLAPEDVQECIKIYVSLSECPIDKFKQMLDNLENMSFESSEIGQALRSPFMCMALAVIFKNQHTDITEDMKLLETDIIQNYITAMVTELCNREHMLLVRNKIPEEIIMLVNKVQEMAFLRCMKENNIINTSLDDNTVIIDNKLMLKFGVLKLAPFAKTSKDDELEVGNVGFITQNVKEFLVAQYLSKMSANKMTEHVRSMYKLVTKGADCSMVIPFLCGILERDENVEFKDLEFLFTVMAEQNIAKMQPTSFSINLKTLQEHIENRSTMKQDINSHALSLRSLMECRKRNRVCEIISETVDSKLVLNNSIVPVDVQIMKGISEVISINHPQIRDIRVLMAPVHEFQEEAFMKLGDAIKQSTQIKSLYIETFTLRLPTTLLACIFKNNQHHSITRVEINFNEAMPQRNYFLDTHIWANIQTACKSMTRVESLTFQNCQSAAIVAHILRHVPFAVRFLNFKNSSFNLMCSQELMSHLQRCPARTSKSLILANTGLESVELRVALQGMKMGDNVWHLNLSGMTFDRLTIESLCEYLQCSRELKILNMNDCDLSHDREGDLADAIDKQYFLKKLLLLNANLTYQAKRALKYTSNRKIIILGLDADI